MTVINYSQFNQLLLKYPKLVILGFPCGQFENQEPGTDAEILNCLKYVRPGGGYVPNFTLFQKTHVNGDPSQIHPVYQYLRAACPPSSDMIDHLPYISWSPVNIYDLSWNFAKFLIDKNGRPYRRYNPEVSPLSLESDVAYLMSK